MNAQMERPHGHEEARSSVEGGGEDVHQHGYDEQHRDHEKKSVLKKVKAKAKKIKDTITKHGHGNDHDHEHHGGHEEEDVDDVEEEMEEDAEVHSAPMYESKEVRTYVPGQGGASIQQEVMSAGGHHTSTDRHGTNISDVNPGLKAGAPELRDYQSFIPEQVGVSKQNGVKFGGGQTPQAAAGSQAGLGGRPAEPADYSLGHTRAHETGTGKDSTLQGRVLDKPSVIERVCDTGAYETGLGKDSTLQGRVLDRPSETGSGKDSTLQEHILDRPNVLEPVGHNRAHGTGTLQGHASNRPSVIEPVGHTGAHETGSGKDSALQGSNLDRPSFIEPVGDDEAHETGSGKDSILQGHVLDRPSVLEPVAHIGAHETGLGKDLALEGSNLDRPSVTEPVAHIGADETGLGTDSTLQGSNLDRPTVIEPVGHVGAHETRSGKDSILQEHDLSRPSVLEPDPHAPGEDNPPENYQSKVKDPTGKGGEEIGVTPILHSLDKMTIYDRPEQQDAQEESLFRPTAAQDRALSTGTGSHDQFSPEPMSAETGSSVQKTEPNLGLSGSLGTSHDENEVSGAQHGSTYTDKLSSATSVIADKAIQAKNVVASKLGYGGDDRKSTANTVPEHKGVDEARKTSSVTEYGKKVGSTVYDKVAGAGGAVMSKLQGSGAPETSPEGQGGQMGAPTENKGLSMKEYIAEKLSPREEDKALSEVISGTLHKTASKEGEKNAEPKGRVTVSAKVARQLGTGNEEEVGSGGSSPGRAMVDRLKGAVTSWWGKGGENEPSSVAFHDIQKEGSEGFDGSTQQGQGEPRLQ